MPLPDWHPLLCRMSLCTCSPRARDRTPLHPSLSPRCIHPPVGESRAGSGCGGQCAALPNACVWGAPPSCRQPTDTTRRQRCARFRMVTGTSAFWAASGDGVSCRPTGPEPLLLGSRPPRTPPCSDGGVGASGRRSERRILRERRRPNSRLRDREPVSEAKRASRLGSVGLIDGACWRYSRCRDSVYWSGFALRA